MSVSAHGATAMAASLSHCRQSYGFQWHKLVQSLAWGWTIYFNFLSLCFFLPLSVSNAICWGFLVRGWRELRHFSVVRGQQCLFLFVCTYAHCSRSWVRDLSSVFLPLKARVLALHVGSFKGLLDVRQREATHRRRLHVFPKDNNTHTVRKTRAQAANNNSSKPSVAIVTTAEVHLACSPSWNDGKRQMEESTGGKGVSTDRDGMKLIRNHTSLWRVGGREEGTTKWFQRGVLKVEVRDRRGGAQVQTKIL